MTQIRLPYQARMELAQTPIPNPFSALPSVAKMLPNQAQHRNFQNLQTVTAQAQLCPTSSTYHHINFMGKYLFIYTSCCSSYPVASSSWIQIEPVGRQISDQIFLCLKHFYSKIFTCGTFLMFKVADYIICKVFVAHMVISINLI